MVEKLLSSKTNKATLDLVTLASEMHQFGQRLESYTESKCAYSRQMDTCILEMLYWTNQSRQIMSQTRLCFEDCGGS